MQGHLDSELSPTGYAQACQTAQALSSLSPVAVYSSDLGRADATARVIAAPHRLTPLPDVRLREACLGDWEGRTVDEISAQWPDIFVSWRRDSLRTRPPGGETLEHLLGRITRFYEDISSRHTDGEVIVVGHGGSIKGLLTVAFNAGSGVFRHFHLDNCSVSVITSRGDRLVVTKMNDTCHLRNTSASFDETDRSFFRQ